MNNPLFSESDISTNSTNSTSKVLYTGAACTAKVGGWLNFGSHKTLDVVDTTSQFAMDKTLDISVRLFKGYVNSLVFTRKALLVPFCLANNLVSTVGLALQTPYLAIVSKPLLKESWLTQKQTITLKEGVYSNRVIIAEVNFEHLRETNTQQKIERPKKVKTPKVKTAPAVS